MTDIIGFIGLGQMGQPIALNLLKAGARDGFDLRVFDLREERVAPIGADFRKKGGKTDERGPSMRK